MSRVLRVAFVRPRLGMGGSERLVLDAALELQARDHEPVLFAPDTLAAPQFDVVREGRLEIHTSGSFIPERVGGRLVAPSAIARCAYAALAARREARRFDVVICDVVAHVVPWVKRATGAPVLYYCHSPDLLLAPAGARARHAYRIYRRPLDRLERVGLAAADRVLVNSRFTQGVVRRTFPNLMGSVEVLYPGVATDSPPRPTVGTDRDSDTGDLMLLAVGRFDPRKNLGAAVDVLVRLRERLPAGAAGRVRLAIAGRCDERLAEHRWTIGDLQERARTGGVEDRVTIIRSPTDDMRQALLDRCACVVYTPEEEHFGYVPIEAMMARRPVVASRRGGPAETVMDGVTGLLVDPAPDAFARAVASLLVDPVRRRQIGEAGRTHVLTHFSRAAFGARLEAILQEMSPD